jgi:hypothetical protein
MTEATKEPAILEWSDDLPAASKTRGKGILEAPPKVILELIDHPDKWGVVEKRGLPAQPNGKWARYRKIFGMGVATRKINGYLYVYGRMTEDAIAAFKEKAANR